FLISLFRSFSSFFFNYTATTEIYTLSLHDALPILIEWVARLRGIGIPEPEGTAVQLIRSRLCGRHHQASNGLAELGIKVRNCYLDRKSTRLNSSHVSISYAVFCLKKKKIHKYHNNI